MTDRELLELAAKAIDGEVFFYGECWRRSNGYEWNPLLNDGDALRLAVKLGLEIYEGCDEAGALTGAVYFVEAESRPKVALEYHNEHADPYSATRRAITRAAAEIGKAMP